MNGGLGVTGRNLRDNPYWLNFIFFGAMYLVSYRTNLGAGATLNLQLKTPPDKLIHILSRQLKARGQTVEMELIKEPTITDGDNEVIPQNMDDRFTKESDLIIYDNPTNVSGGTVKSINVAYGATQGNVTSSALFEDPEIERVLGQDMDYVITITNEGGSATDVMFNILFYESGN